MCKSIRLFSLILLGSIISSCHLIDPYKSTETVPFNLNGIYRGKITYPSGYDSQTSRNWGDWIEVSIDHSMAYYTDDLIADGGTIPMSGLVKTFMHYGVRFEEFKMTGKISFVGINSGYIDAYGSIEMLDNNGKGTGVFFNYKLKQFEAQRQGTTVCDSIPNRPPMKSCGSGKNLFMNFRFWHTSSFYEKETEVLEKCCSN